MILDLWILVVSVNKSKPEFVCVTVHHVHEEPSPIRYLGINCLLNQGLWLFLINLNADNQLFNIILARFTSDYLLKFLSAYCIRLF